LLHPAWASYLKACNDSKNNGAANDFRSALLETGDRFFPMILALQLFIEQ